MKFNSLKAGVGPYMSCRAALEQQYGKQKNVVLLDFEELVALPQVIHQPNAYEGVGL